MDVFVSALLLIGVGALVYMSYDATLIEPLKPNDKDDQ